GKRTAKSSPHIERRRFLQAAAAGLAAGAAPLPAKAQDAVGQRSSSGASDQASLAETLARYAAGLRYEDLPDDVIRLAKRAILDTVGCAFGGYGAGPSRIAIKLASETRSNDGATVFFDGISTSPDLATFANGVMIRYLDFNDSFVSDTKGAGHPNDIIPALLAAAELK